MALEAHLLLLCLIAAKAVYYLCSSPREHDPLWQPGLAISGSSNGPEMVPSPLRNSGSARSPHLSVSSSGRPSLVEGRRAGSSLL